MTGFVTWLIDLRRRYGFVALVSLVAFVVEMIVLRSPTVLGEPYFIARNLANGLGYSYPTLSSPLVPVVTCYIPPLYVWCCAAIMKLGGGLTAMQVFNFLSLNAGVIVLYRFSRSFLSKRLARISYVLLSFYIPLWLLADAIEPNALNFLLIACSALCMYRISQEPRLRNWVLFGGLVGLQILLRPDMLVGAVFCAGWFTITLYRKVGLARLTKWFVVTSVVALAIVLPWTLRNYVVFHRFVLVSANGGYNLWIGNNSSADGELHYASRDRESQLQEDSVHAFAMTHDAVAYDSLYKAFAIYNIISHPMRTMRVDAMKLYYHWWRRQNVGDWNGVNRFILYFDVVSFLLLLFGFLGLIVLKNRQARNLILTFFLYSSTVSVIFFVQTRHRVLKVDPFLIPLAVAGCYTLVERVRGRKYLSAKLADSLRPEPHLSLDQRLAARR